MGTPEKITVLAIFLTAVGLIAPFAGIPRAWKRDRKSFTLSIVFASTLLFGALIGLITPIIQPWAAVGALIMNALWLGSLLYRRRQLRA